MIARLRAWLRELLKPVVYKQVGTCRCGAHLLEIDRRCPKCKRLL